MSGNRYSRRSRLRARIRHSPVRQARRFRARAARLDRKIAALPEYQQAAGRRD